MNKELEAIRHFTGTVEDFKNFFDQKAAETAKKDEANTNAYGTPHYQGFNDVHPTRGANASPHWKESVNELTGVPRSDKAIKDLEKQGSDINYLDDADAATKKIWKKAGINPNDQNTVILYSYVAHPWQDIKNILTKHNIDFKELEDPNSAGESMIVFIEESNSTSTKADRLPLFEDFQG